MASILAIDPFYSQTSGNFIFDDAGVEIRSGQSILHDFQNLLPVNGQGGVQELAYDALSLMHSVAILIDIDDSGFSSPDMVYVLIPDTFNLNDYNIRQQLQAGLMPGFMIEFQQPGEPGGANVCSTAVGAMSPCGCVINAWNQHDPCPPPQYSCNDPCSTDAHIIASMPKRVLLTYPNEIMDFFTQPSPPSTLIHGEPLFYYDDIFK